MKFADIFKQPDINRSIQQFRTQGNAVLLDVRTCEEYAQGHIPGSINLPLAGISAADQYIPATDTPVYVHCHSGARSARAAVLLRQMGYSNVQNIGGISSYTGKTEV